MTTLTRRFLVPEFNTLRREMDRLFNDFQPDRSFEDSLGSVWMPRADLVEGEGAFALTLDLPGIRAEDTHLTLEGNTLTISGQRASSIQQTEERVHRAERHHGRFVRTIQFGVPVDANAIVATFDQGVLTIVVPKSEAIKPRRIKIRGLEQSRLSSADGARAKKTEADIEVKESTS